MVTAFAAVSENRFRATSEGTVARPLRWSTPIRGYRAYGAVSLASGGGGRWLDVDGEYACIDMTVDDVQYHVPPR
jgi:hypothetical protein